MVALGSGQGGARFVVERGGSWKDLGVVEVRRGLAPMLFQMQRRATCEPRNIMEVQINKIYNFSASRFQFYQYLFSFLIVDVFDGAST